MKAFPMMRLPIVKFIEARSAGPTPPRRFNREELLRAIIWRLETQMAEHWSRDEQLTLAINRRTDAALPRGGANFRAMVMRRRGGA